MTASTKTGSTKAGSAEAASTRTGAKKNILLISLDDCVAFWHYKEVFGLPLKTPNLDRICNQSTAFHSAYCQAPICGPSRASFMSGKSPHQSGVFDNKTPFYDRIEPRDMWPYLLRESGYFCSSGGKVHHGFKPLPTPIHEVFYDDEPKHFRIDWELPPEKAQVSLGGKGKGFATTDDADDGYYHDAHSAKSAIKFLNEYSSEAPFYREVGFYSPHGPCITPLRFKEMYPFKELKRPESWQGGFHTSKYIAETSSEDFGTYRAGAFWAKSVRNYFSAISHADHHLGQVWDALKASPHADNTVVIILSDHGFMLGERNRLRKSALWEQVANVPVIVHDPASPEARVVNDPVALLDVGQTALDYAGLPQLPDCLGHSLRPYLSGASEPSRAVPTFMYDDVSIRKGKYRLIRYVDGTTEFYDLEADWWQTQDLGQDHPDYDAMLQALSEACADYGLHLEDAYRNRATQQAARKREPAAVTQS